MTRTLIHLGGGGADPEAIQQFDAEVYGELRALARVLMRRERPDATLRPTELVHEAYLRLINPDGVPWEGRAHFFGSAARAMRRILIDHARKRNAAKRGGGWQRVTLDEAIGRTESPALDLIALDQSLSRLSELDPRMAKIVELRIFAGMTTRDIGCVLSVSKRTVDGEWSVAKKWLRRELMS